MELGKGVPTQILSHKDLEILLGGSQGYALYYRTCFSYPCSRLRILVLWDRAEINNVGAEAR